MKNDALNTSTTEETVTIPRAEYEKTKDEKTTLEAEYAALQEKYASLEAQVNWLMEQLRLVRHRQFGSSSERISEDGMEQSSLLFNEAEVYADEEKSKPTPVAVHVRRKRSGSVREIVPEDIGTEVKETLKFKPAEVYIQRDVYHTYACANCEKNEASTPVVKTPKEPPLIPGRICLPGVCGAYCGTEVRDGQSPVPAGAGVQTAEYPAEPPDYVQLADLVFGKLPEIRLRRAAKGACEARPAPRG